MEMTLAAAVLFARITIITPKEGMAQQFELGYRRHLEWHRAHGDRWAWLGWTVISGRRLGWFVDATVDRTAAELDAPVAPAEDVADNALNVLPYARFDSSSFYRLRPDLCSASTTTLTSSFIVTWTVQVRPGQEQAFETALREGKLPAVCFELVSGGPAATYLVWRGADKLSEALSFPQVRFAEAQSVETEILRYRPDLSSFPAAK